MARVAVLGGGGLIGSHMVKFLKEKGHWVRAVDIKFPDFRKELWEQADEIREMDLRDWDWALPAVEGVEHLYQYGADMGGRGYITDDNEQAANNSEQINLNVRKACIEEGVKRLFFSSSACAYPVTHMRKTQEKDLGTGPADGPYGEEKLFATKRLESLRHHNKLDARVGIFHTIYGPYQEFEGPRMKFPSAITRKVIEADKELKIWGDGTQTRTFLYIDDALEMIYELMTKETYHGPVNISAEEEYSVTEVAQMVCDHAGKELEFKYQKEAPTGPINRGVDLTKYHKHYDYRPKVSTKEGFGKLYDYIAQQTRRP